MTGAEAYELTTRGGATDFARLIEACESYGPYCLIGGLAANADVVVTATPDLPAPASDLRIQFITGERYQAFLPRAVTGQVLGLPVKVACLEHVAQGKLWAHSDPRRRLSKRKKDELDLIRLAEAWPALLSLYPPELRDQISRG